MKLYAKAHMHNTIQLTAVAYFCSLSSHETYMMRCLQLARLGAGAVAPNPMVGAVLVHNDIIIGEGYHQHYGEAHAEVNCINSVAEKNIELISSSTLYVSLEPCAHFGKTPPCADLIIAKKIPTVVIGCRDSYHEVDGKGIEKLKAAGVQVITGVLEKEAKELNEAFFVFHRLQRPFVVLKWAQTKVGKIGRSSAGGKQAERLLISNKYSNRLVHKLRSEVAAIMVGTNTAIADNPSLDVRLWQGNNPVRMVIDKELRLPADYKLLDGSVKTLVFNFIKEATEGSIEFCRMSKDEPLLPQLLSRLYQLKIQSILVEGGATLLQSFIDGGLWDKTIVITNESLIAGSGIAAPILSNQQLTGLESLAGDSISYYRPQLKK